MIRFLNDGHPIEQMYVYASKVISVDIDITVSFSLEDAYELSCNIDLDIDGAGGHAVIIKGMRWDAMRQCMVYTVFDPNDEPLPTNEKSFTYNELIYRSYDIDGDSRNDELTLWTSSVVLRTEYTDRHLFDNKLIINYNSVEIFGGVS